MRKKVALERIGQLENELQACEQRLNTLSVQYEKMLNDYKLCYSALEASQQRIKELSQQNTALSAEAEEIRSRNAKLCAQNEEYRAEKVAAESAVPAEPTAEEAPLTEEPLQANVAATDATPAKTIVKISEIEKYGSSVIGKVVVEATRIIGELAGKASPNAKDVLTLVLGRTEVLKSEVLAIVKDDSLNDEQKKQRIDGSREQAMEYLESLMAQE